MEEGISKGIFKACDKIYKNPYLKKKPFSSFKPPNSWLKTILAPF